MEAEEYGILSSRHPRLRETISVLCTITVIAVDKNPDELIELKMEGLRNIGNISKEYQAEEALEGFFFKSKLTDSVKFGYKTAILSFYQHNRRIYNQKLQAT